MELYNWTVKSVLSEALLQVMQTFPSIRLEKTLQYKGEKFGQSYIHCFYDTHHPEQRNWQGTCRNKHSLFGKIKSDF